MSSRQTWIAGDTRLRALGALALVLALGVVGLADAAPAQAHAQVLDGLVETDSATGAAAVSDGTPFGAPDWAHETVAGGGATAWVEQSVSTAAGGALRIRGTGWVTQGAGAGSTVAIKLSSGPVSQYSRSGDSIISHPSAGGEATIWALLAPENPTGHPAVHTVSGTGDFDITIDLPEGLVAGQQFTVRFQSGLFAAGDTQRTLTTAPLVVGGVPYVDEGEETLPTCVPSSAQPTVEVADTASIGGTVRVSGTGWCIPGEGGGGSRIAIKIDEGSYSRLNADIHSNRTIWVIVDADHATGDWQIDMDLPDGTDSTSIPAFIEGSHTLRLLTGSLKEGDVSRSVKTDAFVVGEYAPGALPEPLDIDGGALNADTRGGVVVAQRDAPAPGSWLLTVPGGEAGDWVFVNSYVGASARTPFAQWHRLDANGQVRLSLSGVTLPTGEQRVTVQSGNKGRLGELLGWASVTVAAPTGDTKPVDDTPAASQPAAPIARITTAVSAVQTTAPVVIPAAPVKRGSQLTAANIGAVTGYVSGGVVTLTLPEQEADQWVYAYVFTGAETRPVGWLQLDSEKRVRVDIGELPAGNHKVALVSASGELIGWAMATRQRLTAATLETADHAEPEDTGSASEAAAGPRDGAGPGQEWTGNLLLLGGAAVLLVGAAATAIVVRSRRMPSSSDAGSAGSPGNAENAGDE